MSPNSSTSSSEGGAAGRRFFAQTLAAIAGTVLAVASFNYVVDPFAMNGRFLHGLDRNRVSRILNYRLYKAIEYRRHPAPAVVLGDSRCDLLRAEAFARAGEPGVYNLSFGGGTLPETVDAFWLAAASGKLERVFFCAPFDTWSETNPANLVPEALALIDNPVSYYTSLFVARASGMLLYESATGTLLYSEKPALSREAFWQRQLGPEVTGTLIYWRRPVYLDRRVAEIAAHCREHAIDLFFVIPPQHADLRAKIDEYGLADEYARMKTRLAELAPVVDYDVPSELTRDAANFNDPYHLTQAAADRLVADLVRDTQGG